MKNVAKAQKKLFDLSSAKADGNKNNKILCI
jgi:hypothetical protein